MKTRRISRKPARRIIDERTTGRDDHCTPKAFIDRIVTYRKIGLDPAGSNGQSPARKAAKRSYLTSRGEDGLTLRWRGFGLVFCNPPYGTQARLWVKKAVREFFFSPSTHADELIMLVAARVDTRWMKYLWRHANAVLLCDKRFQFIGEKDPAKFPQAIVYFGKHARQFSIAFRSMGLVIERTDSVWALDQGIARLHFTPASAELKIGSEGTDNDRRNKSTNARRQRTGRRVPRTVGKRRTRVPAVRARSSRRKNHP